MICSSSACVLRCSTHNTHRVATALPLLYAPHLRVCFVAPRTADVGRTVVHHDVKLAALGLLLQGSPVMGRAVSQCDMPCWVFAGRDSESSRQEHSYTTVTIAEHLVPRQLSYQLSLWKIMPEHAALIPVLIVTLKALLPPCTPATPCSCLCSAHASALPMHPPGPCLCPDHASALFTCTPAL